jgi:hypothetical protein
MMPAGLLGVCKVCAHPIRAGESLALITRDIPLEPFPPLTLGGPAHGDCARKDSDRPEFVVVERNEVGYPIRYERRWDA